MFLKAFALSSACLVLAACGNAPIPVASTFDYSTQKKVRSAGHWDLLTNDVAAQTLAMLEHNGVTRSAPIYVHLPAETSVFDRGFRELLVTKLVQGGGNVLNQPAPAALQLTYSTQVVVRPRPQFIPGQFTVIAGGLLAAYGLRAEHLDTKLLAGLGLAGAGDFANSINAGGPTNTEIILSTSVSRDNRYLARKTDVYYLENVDAALFMPPPLPVSPYPARPMKVVTQ